MAKPKKKNTEDDRTIANNRKAYRDYTIEDSFEVGIVLQGTEVKSLRGGNITLKDAYATIKNGELWLLKTHIEEYTHANRFNHQPERERKLLMQKNQIERLNIKLRQEGYTLIPLKVYFKKQFVKINLGLCKGKKKHDQRQDIAKREAKRSMEQAMKRRR